MANTKNPVKKDMENTLSDKYLRNILDNMHEGVQIIDPDFRYLYLNIAAVEQGKHSSADELVGHTMMEMYPGIEKTEVFKKIREALEKKVATHIENEFEFPDGSKGWFEIRIRPIPEGVFIISLDITDNKNNEKISGERERLLKEAQVVAHLGVYRTDFIKNKWESSEVLDEIFGIGKDYTRSVDGWASLIHPDDRKMMTDYLQNEVFFKKQNFDKEYRIIQKNSGRERWVHGLGEMTFDKQNKPLTMVGTIQDITERKKTEEKIKKSQEQYRALVEDSSDRIYIIDRDYHIQYINNTGSQQIGRKAEELVGKPLSSVFPPETLAKVKQSLGEAFKTKKPVYIEQELNIGGHSMWFSTWQTPLHGEKDEVNAVMGISRDITKTKQAEAILIESENRYRTLVDVAPLCIKWFDEKGKLVSINQHGKEEHFLVGKSDEEIRNWNYIECIVEKYRGLVKESLSKALGGKSSEFDMEHVPGTSTGHWCHSYMVPAMDDKGKVKYVLFISRDFTSEKIAEDEKNENLGMLEKFKKLTIGRELKMMELKKEIAALQEKYEGRVSGPTTVEAGGDNRQKIEEK